MDALLNQEAISEDCGVWSAKEQEYPERKPWCYHRASRWGVVY